jgi:transcription antitermination factor NusG
LYIVVRVWKPIPINMAFSLSYAADGATFKSNINLRTFLSCKNGLSNAVIFQIFNCKLMKTSLFAPQWYVLYTRHNYTRKIAEAIRSVNGECFMPMRRVLRKWSDRVKKTEEPLFLNYLFVKTLLSQKTSLLEIDGVQKFVSLEGKPVPVSETTIAQLKLMVGESDQVNSEHYLQPGDKIKIVSGVFSGIEGVLLRKKNEIRLMVRLPLLKQAISVELSSQDIYKISEGSSS